MKSSDCTCHDRGFAALLARWMASRRAAIVKDVTAGTPARQELLKQEVDVLRSISRRAARSRDPEYAHLHFDECPVRT